MSRYRPYSRRELLRTATGAALAVLASGTRVLLNASPARAQEDLDTGCCVVTHLPSQWCPFMCSESGLVLRCWTCNNGSCKCCECTSSGAEQEDTCFVGHPFACSYMSGCC